MSLAEYSQDSAAPSPDQLTVDKLDSFLYEIRHQREWRRASDLCADYYDGNQLDSATLEDMQRLGMAPLIRNLIQPTINVALGMEAKTRSDWRVQADAEQYQDVAEALSVKLKESERESRADRACSEAYAGQLKAGLGWVEVSREMDPFRYPYRVAEVNRREIFWDWRAKDPGLSDARYLVRRRWLDTDIIELMFPEQKELINAVGWTKANWDTPMTDFPTMMARSWTMERDVTIPESDWRDQTRKRLCLYEVWYRVWKRGFVIRTPQGRTIEVDLNNPRHAQAIAGGMIEPIPAIYPKMRLSWWIGPHRIADMPTPYPHNNFPYIPFWGYREDLTGIPYGLVRSMMSPQDEVNARLSKMMWLLSAKRVIMDSDAVDDVDEMRREVARPDALIVLAKNRRRDGIFKVESDFQLSQQQFEVLQDATQALQKTAGIYSSMLGDKQPGGANSGVALNTLVDQGTTTLAEINDNYRYGRTMVGDALVSLIREDLGHEPAVVNVEKRFGKQARAIGLNTPRLVQGVKMLDNDVQRSLVKVALEDVPSTPSYRAQQMWYLTEMAKSMPPQIQAFVFPFILEASEMPHRREIADQVRTALGQAAGGQDQNIPPEQVKQIVEQEVKKALAASGRDIDLREVKVKEFDAETKRLAAEKDMELTALDTLLTHDAALDDNNPARMAA